MKVWLPAVRVGTGVDVFTQRLDRALRARGIDSRITWFPVWYEYFPELMRFHAPPPGTDVIHGNSWLTSAFLGCGVPVVATVHHLVHDPAYAPFRTHAQALYHRWHIREHELRTLRNAEAATAVSAYVARTVETFSGRAPITVVPNWVDTTTFSPDPSWTSDSSKPFRLLLVGNHSRRKGFDLLPALAAALGPRFELRCTGGLRGSGLEAMPDVKLLGRLAEADLISEYQSCDAVISLSRYEGFGYTALEGMACGKPFIGFGTSGLAEVIENGVSGFLVATEDLSAMAARCMELAGNRALTARMGCAGRRRAINDFPEVAAIDAYIQIYGRLIGRNGLAP